MKKNYRTETNGKVKNFLSRFFALRYAKKQAKKGKITLLSHIKLQP